MKHLHRIVYALLISWVITALLVLTQFPNDSRRDSIQMAIVSGTNNELNYSSAELELKSNNPITAATLDGMFPAVRTLNESADETEMDAVVPPAETQAQVHASGAGGLIREEMVTEGNRIMSDLYRDGILTEPMSYACAFANTSPDTETSKNIIERFRGMHQKHLALVERTLTSGDRDSLVIRGWSKIRIDLAKIQTMAADLRNETALAAR